MKAAVQIVLLYYCMFIKLPRPDTVLVQNPPAIPTLGLCVMVCWWHGAKLVIDWHNFGYTIMSLTMGRRHPLVSQTLLTSQVLGSSVLHTTSLLSCTNIGSGLCRSELDLLSALHAGHLGCHRVSTRTLKGPLPCQCKGSVVIASHWHAGGLCTVV